MTSLLSLLFFLSPTAAEFDLTLLVTREIRGTAYPVTDNGAQCDANADQCSCFGGSARRRTITGAGGATDAPNVVAIDTGAYFSGAGTFFPVFAGNASAEFFAGAAYSAFGLTYRDFSAAGPSGLKQYLERARIHRPDLPDAVITNYMETGDDVLGPFISPYTLIPLLDNRTLAILSLTDPTHLSVTHSDYAARLGPFWRALAVALGMLRRLPGGAPDVIACIVTAMPLTNEEVEAAGSTVRLRAYDQREGGARGGKLAWHGMARPASSVPSRPLLY